ncbi:hypothetical protein M3Y94_00456700 [Aphelenchoides besseyi]|nr:hypothetical protein M3Y94_00456700 [Aphelenchoides besseyi]
MCDQMSLFNEINQLRREVSELKRIVESVDTTVKHLQKQVQEKCTAEMEFEDVKPGIYKSLGFTEDGRLPLDWPTKIFMVVFAIFLIAFPILVLIDHIQKRSRNV